jgi:hypothetical protein
MGIRYLTKRLGSVLDKKRICWRISMVNTEYVEGMNIPIKSGV